MGRNQAKICADCTHYARDGKFDRCSGTRSLITGERSTMSAQVVRGDKRLCGPQGQFFELATTAPAKPTTEKNGKYPSGARA